MLRSVRAIHAQGFQIGTPAAAPYPDRPIAIVVPFGNGTTADLIATVVAEAMSKTSARNSSSSSSPALNLSLYESLPYDPDKIIPITPISAVCNVATVHPSNPAHGRDASSTVDATPESVSLR